MKTGIRSVLWMALTAVAVFLLTCDGWALAEFLKFGPGQTVHMSASDLAVAFFANWSF